MFVLHGQPQQDGPDGSPFSDFCPEFLFLQGNNFLASTANLNVYLMQLLGMSDLGLRGGRIQGGCLHSV